MVKPDGTELIERTTSWTLETHQHDAIDEVAGRSGPHGWNP